MRKTNLYVIYMWLWIPGFFALMSILGLWGHEIELLSAKTIILILYLVLGGYLAFQFIKSDEFGNFFEQIQKRKR